MGRVGKGVRGGDGGEGREGWEEWGGWGDEWWGGGVVGGRLGREGVVVWCGEKHHPTAPLPTDTSITHTQ